MKLRQNEVRIKLDSLIRLLQEKSLYSERVDWKRITNRAQEIASGKENLEEAFEAFQYVFASVGDHHGMLRIKNREFRLPPTEQASKQDSLIVAELSNKPQIVVKQLGNLGYVRIPHMPLFTQSQIDRWANMLNDSICQIAGTGVKSWIIDLRMNVGGNFRPMLAGISCLLGDGLWGSFVDNTKKPTELFELQNGQFFINGKQEAYLISSCKQNPKAPLAVLIGSSTGSSGEVTAIALTGRSNTKFFGTPTYGLANSTEGFYLASKDIYVLMTTAQIRNRNGKVFESQKILPDYHFASPFQLDVSSDPLVTKAIEWLNSNTTEN